MANPLDDYLQPNPDGPSLNDVINGDDVPTTRLTVRPTSKTNKLERAASAPVYTDPMTGFDPTAMGTATGNTPQDLPSMLAGLSNIVQRITGTKFGEPRTQLWPERMIRSGLSLAGDVVTGEQPLMQPGLRREDYTDIPPPQGPIPGSPWIAQKLGLSPVAASPYDLAYERAQDLAGMMGGSTLFEKPNSASLGSGAFRVQKTPRGEDMPGTHRLEAKDVSYGDGQVNALSPEAGHYVVNDVTGERTAFPPTREGHTAAVEAWRAANKPAWDVLPAGADTSGHYKPVKTFASKQEADQWVKDHAGSSLGPGSKALMSDSGEPGAAIAGLEKAASPPFYSALENAVSTSKQATATPDQWMGYLRNQPGVKPEEIQWTGIEDWMKGQKGKIGKEDVQSYLDEHKVEVKDVSKGDVSREEAEHVANDYVHHAVDDFVENEGRDPTPAELRQIENEVITDIQTSPRDYGIEEAGGKYAQYQLPGGENYREHLLTLPPKPTSKPGGNLEIKELPASQGGGFELVDTSQNAMIGRFGTRVEAEREMQSIADNPQDRYHRAAGEYYSFHWDEPNVLAHVRTNDRDVGGVPSHHIEEIQSDWHQEGRKKGYKEDLSSSENVELKALQSKKDEGTMNGDDAVRLAELSNKKAAYGAVPDAPFKTAWPELAMKRMIRQAVDEGKTRVSWTPGEAQAARYDLSKQIERLAYDPDTNRLVGFAKGNRGNTPQIDKKVTPDKLMDEIGKEAADKILKAPKGELPYFGGKYHKLENADLKVGGEGMKGFYDQILPKVVEKMGKAHGVKVKSEMVPTKAADIRKSVDGRYSIVGDGRMFDTKEEALKAISEPVHYFDIPPAMADQARGKGFPLFMSGLPFPLQHQDDNPWGKK